MMEDEFSNFDWEFYLKNYEDLKCAGICTKEMAWHHWINHGKKEGRKNNYFSFVNFDMNIFFKFNYQYKNLNDNECIEICKKNNDLIYSLDCFYNKYCDFNILIYKIFNNIFLDDELDILYNFYNKDKDDIVYSLKTFYINYPKFNYNLYRQSYNIKNMSEVDTIIKWYNDGCNYDFLNNSQYNYLHKKKFIIYSHVVFDYSNGGIVVQYFLAKKLDLLGEQVRIFTNSIKCKNDIFMNYYNDDFPIDDNTVVIYCEAIIGNPLNAKNIVRWLLSELGKNVNKNTYLSWNNSDLVYYFNYEDNIYDKFKTQSDTYKILTTVYINPLLKNNNKNKRNGYCFTMRKSNYHKSINYIHPNDSFEITRQHTQNDYNEFFNKYEYFVSYDPLTFLNIIASLCGCISIVYPIKNKTKQDWIKTTPLAKYLENSGDTDLYGVAYGNSKEELEFAKKTIHMVEEQWININNYMDMTIKNFVKDINEKNNKNTVENIYHNKKYNFDWKTYIENYEDLRKAGINTEQTARNHWEQFGKKEGRVFTKLEQQNNDNFDWKTYIENYEDLRNAGIDNEPKARNHWEKFGKKEGRVFTKLEQMDNDILNWSTYDKIFEVCTNEGIGNKEKNFLMKIFTNKEIELLEKKYKKDIIYICRKFNNDNYVYNYLDIKMLKYNKKQNLFHYLIFGIDENRIYNYKLKEEERKVYFDKDYNFFV